MDVAAWRTYVASVLKLGKEEFSVDILTGGYLNSTIRLNLSAPTPLSSFFPSPIPSKANAQSLVLKHAPPHMASDPSTALSSFRQTREARALELLAEPKLESAWHASGVLVPKLVRHDVETMVLWMTDLGRMVSLTDYLRGADLVNAGQDDGTQSSKRTINLDAEGARARDVGERVGRAFAQLHLHTLNPAPDLVARFNDPLDGSDADGDIEKHQAKQLLELMEQFGGKGKYPDAADLCQRLGLGIGAAGPLQEQVLSMGDIWPGSILLDLSNDRDTPSPMDENPASPSIGLIDWEFFGASHPGAQIGTLAGHLSVHLFELDYPPNSIPPVKANTRRVRIAALGSALIQSYLRAVRGKINCTPAWRRSVLCSWGREVGNAPGFWADLLSEKGKECCVEMGAEALRAAGPDTSSIDLTRKGLPEGLLANMLHWEA